MYLYDYINRDLDSACNKNALKARLIEALKNEGQDPEIFIFDEDDIIKAVKVFEDKMAENSRIMKNELTENSRSLKEEMTSLINE